MSEVVSRRLFTAEARVRSLALLCGICGRRSSTGASVSPSTTIFLWQYHSISAPRLSSSTSYPYKEDKRAKLATLPKISAPSGYRGASDGKVLSALHNSSRLLSARDTPGQGRQQFSTELKDKCGHEPHQGSTPTGTGRLSVAKWFCHWITAGRNISV